MKKLIMMIGAAAIAAGANASSITIDSVAQRWPWNNKVDITYTVTDGQDVGMGIYARIVFEANIGGAVYTIDGVTNVGANASSGTHTVTWNLPSGLRAKDCTMTATIYAADNPSGDDYMVVDLATGTVAYEGLLATQDASNERYNTALYKTDKLVLRKVPAGGPYRTGATGQADNSLKNWTTDRDYYMGVFPVTQRQYYNICASNPSQMTGVGSGDVVAHRPVENVKWDDLRISTTASTSSIPAVAVANTGTFLQRLNFKTGIYFDLPTEVMFEIAQRAGTDTAYSWGASMDYDYVVRATDCTVAVGSRKPNNWGLYDTAGNVYEWCLDVNLSNDNMSSHLDVFTPFYDPSTHSMRMRGGGVFSTTANADFLAYSRTGGSGSFSNNTRGFRVSFIVR